MRSAIALCAAAAFAVALAACGRSTPPTTGEEIGAPQQEPAPPATGTLKLRLIYDYVGDRQGTPWESFELNGEYNWPEAIFAGWPIRVTPIDGTPGSPVVVETLRELSPTDGRYLSLPAGRYRVDEFQPTNRFILGGPGFWTSTGANVTQGGTTTSFGPGTPSLTVEVMAGTDHATATVARFFEVCQEAFPTSPVRTTVLPEFAGVFTDDVKTAPTNCVPQFAGYTGPTETP